MAVALDIRQQDASGELEDVEVVDAYQAWQEKEGVPSVTGFYIEDLKQLDLSPWPRKGGKGTFVNLEGTGGVNDMQVVEIAPGGKSEPEKHMYEEMVYILMGHGSTSVWYEDGKKLSFEWGPGSVFAIPLNANYQHFNGSGNQPARYAAVTNAPTIIRLFHNADFLFNNAYQFRDRFSGEDRYFSGDGRLLKRKNRRLWDANFVPDVHSLHLPYLPERGGGGSNVHIHMAENSMGAHISQFQVGMYKKGHRHGPGAHVIILEGQGFSMLWQEGGEANRKKCEWQQGTVVVPPDQWFHQHFNTGREPARYLALRMGGMRFKQAVNNGRGTEGSAVSLKLGGWQIEYEDEDPAIHKIFEADLKAHGATCRMKGMVAGCTGIEGTLEAGGDD